MLRDNLIHIQNELRTHHRDKATLEMYYVQSRLNKSLKSYYADLSSSVNYLSHRKVDSIVRYL